MGLHVCAQYAVEATRLENRPIVGIAFMVIIPERISRFMSLQVDNDAADAVLAWHFLTVT